MERVSFTIYESEFYDFLNEIGLLSQKFYKLFNKFDNEISFLKSESTRILSSGCGQLVIKDLNNGKCKFSSFVDIHYTQNTILDYNGKIMLLALFKGTGLFNKHSPKFIGIDSCSYYDKEQIIFSFKKILLFQIF